MIRERLYEYMRYVDSSTRVVTADYHDNKTPTRFQYASSAKHSLRPTFVTDKAGSFGL
jgi:hypothetical protein